MDYTSGVVGGMVSPGCCSLSYGTVVWKRQNLRPVFAPGSLDEARQKDVLAHPKGVPGGIRGPEKTGWAVYALYWTNFHGRPIRQMRSVSRCPGCGKDLSDLREEDGISVDLMV